MKVKMLKTTKGSSNGYEVNTFREGEVYEVSDSLGQNFIDNKNAEAASGDATQSFQEASADDSQLGASRRGSVDFDIEGQNDADKEANIIRPEMDRLLEISRAGIAGPNQTQTTSVIEPHGRAKRKVTTSAAENMQDSQGTTAALRASSAQKGATKAQGKALKGTDYENKAVNPNEPKKGK